MRLSDKILLIAFGGFVGIASAMPVWWWVTAERVDGRTSFENVADLHRALKQRDERDIKTDGSVSLRSIIRPHKSDDIIYELIPNLNVRFQGVLVETNVYGMRDGQFSVEKDAGVLRIALLGDSFAFGWGVEEKDCFATVLERELNSRTQGSPQVELFNLGVPGYSTFQQVAHFEEVGLQFKPDAVLVFVVDNDFGLPFFLRSFGGEGALTAATSYEAEYNRAPSAERGEHRNNLLHRIDPNRALGKLAELGRFNGFTVYVTVNPNPKARQVLKNLWVLRERGDIKVLRLRKRLLKEIASRGLTGKDLVLPNDPHPSPVKHRLLGTLLADDLQRELGRAKLS